MHSNFYSMLSKAQQTEHRVRVRWQSTPMRAAILSSRKDSRHRKRLRDRLTEANLALKINGASPQRSEEHPEQIKDERPGKR